MSNEQPEGLGPTTTPPQPLLISDNGNGFSVGSAPLGAYTDPTIDDGGDDQQLQATRPPDDIDNPSTIRPPPDDNIESTLQGTGYQFYNVTDERAELEYKPNLEAELRAALETSAWKSATDKSFIPLDKLDQILRKQAVKDELASWNEFHDEDTLEHTVSQILTIRTVDDIQKNNHPNEPRVTTKTTLRKLFAILVLSGRARTILNLIKEGIYDIHLPFSRDSESKTLKVKKQPNNVAQNIDAFSKWELRDHDTFNMYQWHVQAPYFVFSRERRRKVRHYRLNGDVPLPFITDSTAPTNDAAYGGFGEVRRVRIHRAHFNGTEDSDGVVAIKTLAHYSPPNMFRDEVNAYRALMNVKNPNPHLTRLLVSIEHGTYKRMMFPWAEGNLLEFWQSDDYADVSQQKADVHWVRWMAKQFAGLAGVLKLVHAPTKFDPSLGDDVRNRFHPTKYGKHGDLKPENILLFKESISSLHLEFDSTDRTGRSPPKGILKVCDLGLTTFHSKNSLNQRVSKTAISKTHRAPEYDSAKEVTPDTDLWSFGCILLEFLVWYQDGKKGVDRFSQDRIDDEKRQENLRPSAYYEDKFFMRSSASSLEFVVKNSVIKQISDLRAAPKSSDFTNAVLELIEIQLLQVDVNRRTTCEVMHKDLERIHELTKESLEYCTKMSESPSQVNQIISFGPNSAVKSSQTTPLVLSTKDMKQPSQFLSPAMDQSSLEEPAKPASSSVQDSTKLNKSLDSLSKDAEQPLNSHTETNDESPSDKVATLATQLHEGATSSSASRDSIFNAVRETASALYGIEHPVEDQIQQSPTSDDVPSREPITSAEMPSSTPTPQIAILDDSPISERAEEHEAGCLSRFRNAFKKLFGRHERLAT